MNLIILVQTYFARNRLVISQGEGMEPAINYVGLLKDFYVYILILNLLNVRLEVDSVVEGFEPHHEIPKSNLKHYYFFFSNPLNRNLESVTANIFCFLILPILLFSK